MLSPPEDLSDDALVSMLGDGWALPVSSIEYRPVGFGSHHWEVVDAEGVRRFVTVDDLGGKSESLNEPSDSAFRKLRAALATAVDLGASGSTFVIAPIPTRGGEPLLMTDGRFGVALYPYVEGESYSWGDSLSTAHRRGILDLIVSLHSTPTTQLRHAMVENFVVPHRDELESTLRDDGVRFAGGPYARPKSRLLIENADKLERMLVQYATLVEQHGRQSGRMVLTHGEPHPGNTMLTPAGWVLIDWDTVLIAPPERDLWNLDPGDGSVLRAYTGKTGTAPRLPMLELYRIRWDLADIAVYVSQFRAPHSGSPDDEKAWDGLCSLMGRLPA